MKEYHVSEMHLRPRSYSRRGKRKPGSTKAAQLEEILESLNSERGEVIQLATPAQTRAVIIPYEVYESTQETLKISSEKSLTYIEGIIERSKPLSLFFMNIYDEFKDFK